MTQLFANNAKTTLNGSITAGATTIPVTDGSVFPSPAGDDYFLVTMSNGSNIEIVKCTSRATNNLTVVRGQEGTTGFAFANLDDVELRVTAETLGNLGNLPSVTLVSEQIITTAVTSLTFSGLDSDTDGFYFLELEKDPSVTSTWYLHVNGNTTLSNYYTQSAYSSGTTSTPSRLNSSDVIYSATGGGGSFSQVYCTVLDNNYFAYTSFHGRNVGGTTPEIQHYLGGSNFTLTNITSLTLTAGATNGIGVGSVIRLYRGK